MVTVLIPSPKGFYEDKFINGILRFAVCCLLHRVVADGSDGNGIDNTGGTPGLAGSAACYERLDACILQLLQIFFELIHGCRRSFNASLFEESLVVPETFYVQTERQIIDGVGSGQGLKQGSCRRSDIISVADPGKLCADINNLVRLDQLNDRLAGLICEDVRKIICCCKSGNLLCQISGRNVLILPCEVGVDILLILLGDHVDQNAVIIVLSPDGGNLEVLLKLRILAGEISGCLSGRSFLFYCFFCRCFFFSCCFFCRCFFRNCFLCGCSRSCCRSCTACKHACQ